MFGLSDSSGVEFTARDEALLKEMVITNDGPGTILRDFEVLLDYVQTNEPTVTKNYQLPMKALEPINGCLTHPIPHNLSRPTQKSLPNVGGLYLLFRASGLAFIDTSSKKPRLKLNEQVLSSWQRLNPTERYFTLLESWLLRGSEELLGESYRSFYSFYHPLTQWLYFHIRLQGPDWPAETDNLANALRYLPGLHNLALMEMFGFVIIESGAPAAKGGWQITAVEPTQYGKILLGYLEKKVLRESNILLELESPAQVMPGQLQPFIQPYFPQWQNNIQWPEVSFRSGTHIFRVSLSKSIWRRIAIDAETSLEFLADVILDAFDFANDHLHRFIYRSHLGTNQDVNHPYMDEGPFTSEVRVGDMTLPIGGTMDFNFDFGDDWYFTVQLESVEEGKELKQPKILESHGKAPEQYPSYGDEW